MRSIHSKMQVMIVIGKVAFPPSYANLLLVFLVFFHILHNTFAESDYGTMELKDAQEPVKGVSVRLSLLFRPSPLFVFCLTAFH